MRPRIPHRRPRRPRGFTMAELLDNLIIITILAGSLAVVIPIMRSKAMEKRAKADILAIATALTRYHKDTGGYPVAAHKTDLNAMGGDVLYDSLCNPHAGGANRGWGSATTEASFIHQGTTSNVTTYTHGGGTKRQIQDPWGLPYYYIAHPDYLRGVRYYENGSTSTIVYGTTPAKDDFWGDPADSGGADDHLVPRKNYFGPPPRRAAFYNADSFQIHSKGRDQATDIDDDEPGVIDACDRGTDTNDIHNW